MLSKPICWMVDFNCKECGKHVRKWWHPRYYGKPGFCSRECKSAFQRRRKPVTKEWLEQKYIEEGLGCPEIAAIVGRHPKRVYEWLKNLGIPTRPRGANHVENLVHGLKREQHPNWRGGVAGERQTFARTLKWRRAAMRVWRRDNATCQNCGRKFKRGGMPFDVHHIAPFRVKRLRCRLSNLVLLCERCHYWVHGSKNKEGRFLKSCR